MSKTRHCQANTSVDAMRLAMRFTTNEDVHIHLHLAITKASDGRYLFPRFFGVCYDLAGGKT